MMPLTLASVGEENIIRKVGGNPEVKKHLEDLALLPEARDGDFRPRRQPHCQREGFPDCHQREMAGKIMV